MKIPYQSAIDLALSLVRFDGMLRNFINGKWEVSGPAPTLTQLLPFKRMGPGLFSTIQWAELPGVDGGDDDARQFGCFRFDGTTWFATSAPGACVTPSRRFTWACWFRRRGPAVPNATLIGEGASAGQQPLFQLRAGEVDSSRMGCVIRDNAGVVASVTGATAVDADWHHVAASCDGATLSLYLDGRLDGSAPIAALGVSTLNRACFGALHRATASFPWTGELSDVRCYGRALPAEEIASVARRWLAGPTGGGDLAVAIWTMGEGQPRSLLETIALSWYAPGQPSPGGAG